MKAKKIELAPARNGEWLRPKHDGFLMACCDCGLIHKVNFVVQKYKGVDRVYMQVFRQKAMTKRFRKQEDIIMRELPYGSIPESSGYRKGGSRRSAVRVREERGPARAKDQRKVLRGKAQNIRRKDGPANHSRSKRNGVPTARERASTETP